MSELVNDILAHHGVKGMHWGISNDDHPGASRKVNKDAKKDAKEFARAKLFFGEGAGTRRKLIKAKVESKSARVPGFKVAFDHHLARQDLSEHASKAQSERRRKDVKNSTGKTARGIKNTVLRTGAPVSVAGLALGTAAMHPQVRATLKRTGSTSIHEARRLINAQKLKRTFRTMG